MHCFFLYQYLFSLKQKQQQCTLLIMPILKFIKILIYGNIKKTINVKKNKNFSRKKISFDNKYKYNIYDIKNARLYTGSIHDTAVILNNQVVAEASYQYRLNKINDIIPGKVSENIIFKEGTAKFKKIIIGDVFCMSTGGVAKKNYWHWLFEVLPRLGILEKSKFKFKKEINYLLPSIKLPFQLGTLKKLNIRTNKCLDGNNYKHLSCDRLITVDHPFIFGNSPSRSMLYIPKWIVIWLRKKFKYTNNFNKKKYSKKIFIDRIDATDHKSRHIINDDEVKTSLKKLGFKILVLSKVTFEEQVKIFQEAKIIVGLHGAGFGNIIFSKKGTKVIELKSKTSGNAIKNLAITCNLNYKKISTGQKNKELKRQQGNIFINIKKLNKVIFSN